MIVYLNPLYYIIAFDKFDGLVGRKSLDLFSDTKLFPQDIEIEVCGILNDTTGTLMSCAWKNPNCRVGVIVGKKNQKQHKLSVELSHL